MQTLTQPTLLKKPFSIEGDRNSLPVTNSDPTEPQRADLTNGFPPITSLAPDEGGLPPERKDFNALGYLTTSYDYFYQAGGTFTYNPEVAEAIGGYPLGARLWFTNSLGVSMILRSTIANNTNNFLTDSSVIGLSGEGKPWERENFLGYTAPYRILQYAWFDYELDDMSWLQANTFSWQDGTLYTEVYSHLVDDIDDVTPTTELVGSYTITYYQAEDGHKIVTDDQETTVQAIYEESGVAWYYILDTINERFKLPRENPDREQLVQVVRAKGDGKTLGLYNGVSNSGLNTVYGGASLVQNDGVYGSDVGTGRSGDNLTTNNSVGITLDSEKSGIISDMTDSTSVYKGKKYLYFYVGQYSQTATEQTAGLNTESFNNKADLDLNNVLSNIDFVIETKAPTAEDPTWYRVYKSKWCEQGGVSEKGNSYNVVFPKEFADTNYTTQVSRTMLTTVNSDTSGRPYTPEVSTKTTTGMRINQQNGTDMFTSWEAKGYIV